ncbi:hypothetical protein B4135_1073 [Caldibacillus debilis]|uniref:Uncharacterized protein n=1 Tax=Caldibacillus debilis TaxID=301148 RepID=A0A150ME78_9BACI|nr:hypothetical protein B4135_1073 [Caldibacillus debilis]
MIKFIHAIQETDDSGTDGMRQPRRGAAGPACCRGSGGFF